MAPTYLIIGAAKSGTTSLQSYLTQHPDVGRPYKKQTDYFTKHFHKSMRWYRAFFPTWLEKLRYGGLKRGILVTGESSPYYLFHPRAARRVARVLPGIRLIVLLRNPIDRAYSHYQHEVRGGREELSFEEALEVEEERLRPEIELLNHVEDYVAYHHEHCSYKSRGIYVDQLVNWKAHFPMDSLLILQSERFFEDTQSVFDEILDFLELPSWKLIDRSIYKGGGSYPPMNQKTGAALTEFFGEPNHRLFNEFEIEFAWDA